MKRIGLALIGAGCALALVISSCAVANGSGAASVTIYREIGIDSAIAATAAASAAMPALSASGAAP
jgi:ABC-type proline/glycine betaine transport system substrate-binding protein